MTSGRMIIMLGDITKLDVDAVVNAANSGLIGGGGVDGAIHRAAGSSLLDECREIVKKQGGCPPGDAVMTGAGNMKCKKIIHTVGPIWHDGNSNESTVLASCYKKSLELARQNGLKTVAFPNISTGVYGYPKIEAAKIALKTVDDFLEKDGTIEKVIFICFDDENFYIYSEEIKTFMK